MKTYGTFHADIEVPKSMLETAPRNDAFVNVSLQVVVNRNGAREPDSCVTEEVLANGIDQEYITRLARTSSGLSLLGSSIR